VRPAAEVNVDVDLVHRHGLGLCAGVMRDTRSPVGLRQSAARLAVSDASAELCAMDMSVGGCR
jgi:hypothetical protein